MRFFCYDTFLGSGLLFPSSVGPETHGMDEDFPRDHLECKKMLPWVAQHARMLYGFFGRFDWGSMKIMKSELSPFCVFFQRTHPTLPYPFPPQTKTQQNIQNLKWDVRDVRSVDFPSFCHILEVTLHLNP